MAAVPHEKARREIFDVVITKALTVVEEVELQR